MGTSHHVGLLVFILVVTVEAQLPRRIQIPGALPVQGAEPKPLPYRRVLQQPIQGSPIRLRRPIPNALPAPLPARETIRPVIEETEDNDPPTQQLNEEVIRVQQQLSTPSPPFRPQYLEETIQEEPAPKPYIPPVQFRPERPIATVAPARFAPQPARQVQVVRAQPQQVRVSRPQARPQPVVQYEDDDLPRRERKRKPPVQILRKYREDNPDGSITWGYENDDGTFKEETIGVDCITRGKYGYIDPDGNRREYTYETGLKCEEQEEELPEELIIPQGGKGKVIKRPIQQQYRAQ